MQDTSPVVGSDLWDASLSVAMDGRVCSNSVAASSQRSHHSTTTRGAQDMHHNIGSKHTARVRLSNLALDLGYPRTRRIAGERGNGYGHTTWPHMEHVHS